jgi:DNA-binding CsgD family transcriptional regulator
MRILLAVGLSLICGVAFCGSGTDSLLNSLVKAVENKQQYVDQRIERINTLRTKLLHGSGEYDRFQLYSQLYEENKKFIYDSAFLYASRMIDFAHAKKDTMRIAYARAKLGFILVSSGFFKEAFDTLKLVRVRFLPDSTKAEFYALVARGYYDLADFDDDHFFKSHYFKLGNLYSDSAREHVVPGTYYDLYLSRIKNIKTENFQAALSNSVSILQLYTLKHQEQAVNFYDLSHAYRMLGQREKAIEFLVKSALADLYAATKETAAMHTLARMLYEDNDIERAHIFIEQARDDAAFYGARQRMVEIGSILPLIAAAKLTSVDSQRRKWVMFSVALVVLVILTIVFAVIIYKQLKKLKAAELAVTSANAVLQETNHHLREANRIKEEYIGYYFNINADYLNKIENFKASLDKKIMAKKWDDVRLVADNINLKREREELSYSFDRVFLNLFPDFITKFNLLFNPEDQMAVKEGQLMNTELRIFALIRMGISDTEKIAKILGYSVNTIYAYKTRVKSKSIVPNDVFEQRIMEIKTA